MKKCPVCSTVCFDDADTCFGCLYRFRKDEAPEEGPQSEGLYTADGLRIGTLITANDRLRKGRDRKERVRVGER